MNSYYCIYIKADFNLFSRDQVADIIPALLSNRTSCKYLLFLLLFFFSLSSFFFFFSKPWENRNGISKQLIFFFSSAFSFISILYLTILVGRYLRRSPAQVLCPYRVSYVIYLVCSGIWPAGSWKPLRTETAQTPWAVCEPVPLHNCSEGKNLPENQANHVKLKTEPLLFSFLPVVLHLPIMFHCEEPVSVLWMSRVAVRCTQSLVISRLNQPWSLNLSPQDKCSSPNWPGGPPPWL